MSSVVGERLVPGRGRCAVGRHGAAAIALIVCTRDAALGAEREQRLEVGARTRGVRASRRVVGQQHGVEGEPLEAAQVHPGDASAVPGDADEAHEPLVARLDQRLERAAGPSAISHSSGSTRLWSWIRSTWSTLSRSSDRSS